MIYVEVDLENLKSDYPEFYNFFRITLSNSVGKYKNYPDKKMKCYYYLGFYMLPSKKTDEYYENLYKMKWDERLDEEKKKAKVTITMVAGKFALSDQIPRIGESLYPFFEEIVARKMYFEQMTMDEPDEEIINSIPNIEELKEKIQEEQEQADEIIDIFTGENGGINKQRELSPDELYQKLLENEEYEEINELLKNHPELKRKK
jgi:hypothetical protein